jgi:protein arginine kinase
VLIHLPALVLLDEIQRVLKSIMQVGLSVRGLYGEHSEVMGNLFQISNQTTLGRNERDSIEILERVTRQIVETRRAERMLRTPASDRGQGVAGWTCVLPTVHPREVINLLGGAAGVALGMPACARCHLSELLV